MKAKDATEENELKVILSAKYTPIYTSWKYGNGKVGTFACDLNGTWSSQFIASEVGSTLLKNMIAELSPSNNSDTEQTESET